MRKESKKEEQEKNKKVEEKEVKKEESAKDKEEEKKNTVKKESKDSKKKVESKKKVDSDKKDESKSGKEENKKIEKENKKVEKATAKVEEAKSKIKSDSKEFRKTKLVATILAIIIVLGLIAYVTNTIIQKQNFFAQNPIATMEVENFGTIKIELYPQYAPETVSNFIALANNGFYDGLTFHRTIPDFMIQGGDPNGDGSGNATLRDLGLDSDDEYTIKGEFIANGDNDNTLKHERGVISMARGDYSDLSSSLATEGYNSGSCQFFITTTDQQDNLDGLYAAFGKVIEGMDVVDSISNVEVETREASSSDTNLTQDKPVNPPVITSIRVETYGVDYGLPQTREPFDINSWYMSRYGY